MGIDPIWVASSPIREDAIFARPNGIDAIADFPAKILVESYEIQTGSKYRLFHVGSGKLLEENLPLSSQIQSEDVLVLLPKRDEEEQIIWIAMASQQLFQPRLNLKLIHRKK